jgi:hypothetical protein
VDLRIVNVEGGGEESTIIALDSCLEEWWIGTEKGEGEEESLCRVSQEKKEMTAVGFEPTTPNPIGWYSTN